MTDLITFTSTGWISTKILYVLGYLADPSEVFDTDPADDLIKVIVEELCDMNVEEVLAKVQSLAEPEFFENIQR